MLLNEKKLFATAADRETYDMLVAEGVLVPHVLHMVAGKQICDTCADGLRPHYKEWVKNSCFSQGGESTFFHTFAGNGNPMRYAYGSPLSANRVTHSHGDMWGCVKMHEIAETLDMADDLKLIVEEMRLAHHWPCKAALKRGITMLQSIDLVVRGKMRIQRQFPGLKICMELFVDWGAGDTTQNVIKKETFMSLLRKPQYAAECAAMMQYEDVVYALPVMRVPTKHPEQSVA